MRIKRYELLMSLLVAAGCSPETTTGDQSPLVMESPNTGSTGRWISVGGSVPQWVGKWRVKVNGSYVVDGTPGGGPTFTDRRAPDGHALMGIQLDPPATSAEIQLVADDGRTLLHTAPLPVPADPDGLFLWVHDSPSGLVGEVPDAVPDNDPETAEIRAVNVSHDERVDISYCLGMTNCPGCYTFPPGQVSFAPGDCTAITTVGPGETWSAKLPVTHVDDGPASGAACLGVRLEGQPMGPTCGVELNTRPLGFHELNYLFIDGLQPTTVQNPDGSELGQYPGIFGYGVSR